MLSPNLCSESAIFSSLGPCKAKNNDIDIKNAAGSPKEERVRRECDVFRHCQTIFGPSSAFFHFIELHSLGNLLVADWAHLERFVSVRKQPDGLCSSHNIGINNKPETENFANEACSLLMMKKRLAETFEKTVSASRNLEQTFVFECKLVRHNSPKGAFVAQETKRIELLLTCLIRSRDFQLLDAGYVPFYWLFVCDCCFDLLKALSMCSIHVVDWFRRERTTSSDANRWIIIRFFVFWWRSLFCLFA